MAKNQKKNFIDFFSELLGTVTHRGCCSRSLRSQGKKSFQNRTKIVDFEPRYLYYLLCKQALLETTVFEYFFCARLRALSDFRSTIDTW